MVKSISWILDFVNKLPDDVEKIKCLRANDIAPIKTVLKYALDPNIKWVLPEGAPPYEPAHDKDRLEEGLYHEARKLYLYIEGGNPNLNPIRREALFIDLLQNIDPEDALMLLAIKDRKFPYENITVQIVNQAFPGLI